MDWVEEFYQTFTDGCDKENEYYDAQFTVNKPCEVEYFIHQLLKQKNNMEEQQTTFLDGFIFKRPREGAPDFVKGAMSIKVDEAVAFLQKNANNGWVNADLLVSKDGEKLYFKLNDWKPENKEESNGEVDKASIPF